MATIRCPHCGLLLELKGVRPGRFSPKCTLCGERFLMEISDDPKPKAYVSKLKRKSKSKAAAPADSHESKTKSKPAPPDPDQVTMASAPPRPLDPNQVTMASSPPRPQADAIKTRPDPDDDSGEIQLALPPDLEMGLPTPEATEDDVADDGEEAIPAAEILEEEPSPEEIAAAQAPPQTAKRPDAPPPGPDATLPSSPARARARPQDPGVTAPTQRAAPDHPTPGNDPKPELSGILGGYQIEKKLGEGGMGAVYLARQLSLDRNVALKTMHPYWSSDPLFLARFTREAYAAAQLTHHQVVQIYDIGQDKSTPFFSMEFVKGQSLADLIKRDGKVDPEAAAGYILQAARGLKFAHDQGMIHRDVKPENLLLNDQGIVKVADLGLVKTPNAKDPAPSGKAPPVPGGAPPRSAIAATATANVTLADAAMGTPAYMAPEQAVDAAKVDARADIYSLGCTFYALVTGAAPFQGKTVMEVLSKHATEAITPPELIVQRLPKELSAIIQKMTAKKPQDRYQDMGQVIKALETFLGVANTGPFTPKEEHAETLEDCVKRFYSVPIARQRTLAILGFYAFCLVVVIAFGMFHAYLLAGGVVGLAILTAVFYQAIIGVVNKAYFFRKCRQLLFSSGFKDWLTYLGVAALLVILLLAFHLLWTWVLFCFVALAVAAGFNFTLDRHLAAERRTPIRQVEDMLKGMRLRGLEEDSLRQFVCKYAGNRWEAFYEALFGYEAKIEARRLWGRGQADRNRPRDGAWRDPIIRWIDQKMRQRREAREKKILQAVEEKSLRARGVAAADAQKQAAQAADTLVSKAAEFKQAAALPAEPGGKAKGKSILSITQPADPDEEAARRREKSRTRARSGPLFWFFGRLPRFALGALLLAGCALWMNQNNLLDSDNVQATNANTRQHSTEGFTSFIKQMNLRPEKSAPLKPIAPIPKAVTDLFDSFSPGIAGLLLLASLLFNRWLLGAVVMAGAAVIFLGQQHLGIPNLGPISGQLIALFAGLALAVLGFLFGRK